MCTSLPHVHLVAVAVVRRAVAMSQQSSHESAQYTHAFPPRPEELRAAVGSG